MLGHAHIYALFLTANTAGVNHHKAAVVHFAVAVFAIAGQSGIVGHQRIATAGEPIKQCGLANIGAPYEGNNRNHGIKKMPQVSTAAFYCVLLSFTLSDFIQYAPHSIKHTVDIIRLGI